MIGLLIKQIAELGVRHSLARTKNAIDVENLFGLSEAEADVAVVEHVNEEIWLERVDAIAGHPCTPSVFWSGYPCRRQKMTPGAIALYYGSGGTTV